MIQQSNGQSAKRRADSIDSNLLRAESVINIMRVLSDGGETASRYRE